MICIAICNTKFWAKIKFEFVIIDEFLVGFHTPNKNFETSGCLKVHMKLQNVLHYSVESRH
jgi:hypothetical protein